MKMKFPNQFKIPAIILMLFILINFIFTLFDSNRFTRLAQDYVINNWKNVSEDTVFIESSSVKLITDKILSTVGFKSWTAIDTSHIKIDEYFEKPIEYKKYYIDLYIKNRILIVRLFDSLYCGSVCGQFKSYLYFYLFGYWIKLPFGSTVMDL